MKKLTFDQVTTRGGDSGETSLYDGSRRRKDDILFDALGDLDELNSYLGVVRSVLELDLIKEVQRNIFAISALIATPTHTSQYKSLAPIKERDVKWVEKEQHKLMQEIEIKPIFVYPGETKNSAHIDVARTIARKCERRVVRLIRDLYRQDLIDSQKYLNRLSDYLFVLARYIDTKHS